MFYNEKRKIADSGSNLAIERITATYGEQNEYRNVMV